MYCQYCGGGDDGDHDMCMLSSRAKQYRDGEPCKHPGCLNHVSHPCEGCGRVAGQQVTLCAHEENDALESRPLGWGLMLDSEQVA